MKQEDTEIFAKVVSDRQMLGFLPAKIPGHYLKLEGSVLSFARRLIENYSGGTWECLELSNGGFYLRPSCLSEAKISVQENRFGGVASGDAAGVIVTLFALNYLVSWSEDLVLMKLYYLLREYAYDHPEATFIGGALD